MTATSDPAHTAPASTAKPAPPGSAWASHLWKERKARAAARTGKPASPAAASLQKARPVVPLAERKVLTIKNTAVALDCSISTVLRLIKDEKLRIVYLSPRAVRVVADSVVGLLG